MTGPHYDAIIIGTGAGGGTLAYHLAPSGKRILVLERGDYVPREKANWDPKVVNVDAHYNTRETWGTKEEIRFSGQKVREFIVKDPDGHAVALIAPAQESRAAAKARH